MVQHFQIAAFYIFEWDNVLQGPRVPFYVFQFGIAQLVPRRQQLLGRDLYADAIGDLLVIEANPLSLPISRVRKIPRTQRDFHIADVEISILEFKNGVRTLLRFFEQSSRLFLWRQHQIGAFFLRTVSSFFISSTFAILDFSILLCRR